MPRQIEVTVDRQGRLNVNFIGFRGMECHEEAEMLRRALRDIGLLAAPIRIEEKSEEEMLAETREPEPVKERGAGQVGPR